MAQRLIGLPWQQQPQEVVLCPSEQYADLQAGWLGSQPGVLVGAAGAAWSRVGSPIIEPSRAGLASRAASYGTAAYYTGPSISGTSLTWPGITVVAVLPTFVDIGGNFPASLCIAPSEDYYGIANLSFQVSGYNSIFWRAGNSANYLTATAYNNTALAHEWAAGDDLVIVARWDKTTSKLAVSRNGIVTRNSAGHAYGRRTGTHLLSVGGHTRSGNRMLVSPLAMAAVLPRDVGDQAEAELLDNPWGLFEFQRIWVPVSAGGADVGLIIADVDHVHTSGSVVLSTFSGLAVADHAHGHASDAVAPSVQASLTVIDAAHAHASDALDLSAQSLLALSAASHAHWEDNAVLSAAGADTLAVSDAAHAHAAEVVALTGASELAVVDAQHGHVVDGLVLAAASVLAIQEALHAHAAEGIDLAGDGSPLLVASALHAHTADGVALLVDAWLVVDVTAHAGSSTNVVLTVGDSVEPVFSADSRWRVGSARMSGSGSRVGLAVVGVPVRRVGAPRQ